LLASGDNVKGVLGDGGTANSDTPVRVQLPDGTRVTGTRAGLFAVAVTTTGKVFAWGRNEEGELGNGTNTDSAVRGDQPGSPET